MKIQRDLFVADQFTQPYHPQQNPVELQAIKYLKQHAHALLDRTGAPDPFWFPAIQYLAEIHNICADPSIKYAIPKAIRTGVTQDISAYLQFKFFEPILYLDHENTFPMSKERTGRYLHVAENIGDKLTYFIYDEQTRQVLARSVVRTKGRNYRVKFDPFLSKHRKHTASNGGEVWRDPVAEGLSDMDKYDEEESDLEPCFFDTQQDWDHRPDKTESQEGSNPTTGSNPSTPPEVNQQFKEAGNKTLFVPSTPDDYDGASALRFDNDTLDIDPDIPYLSRRGKVPYSEVKDMVQEPSPEVEPVMPESNPVNESNPMTPKTRPTRTKRDIDRLTFNTKTKWSFGRAIKSFAMLSVSGVSAFSTHQFAESCMDVQNHKVLWPKVAPTAMIYNTERVNELLAYHTILDSLNSL
jgi:hypothetical protein